MVGKDDRYVYSNEKCIFRILKSKEQLIKSEFDTILCNKWDEAKQNKLFRYDLETLTTKFVKGSYCFVVQLNSKRAFERREPQKFQKMHKPFDMNIFNFTKVNPCEILFEFCDKPTKEKNFVIINVSPLEYGNVLFAPGLMGCLPQILTQDAITLALKMILSSSHNGFRIAYNSQLASASVNHLHLHAYYVNHELLVETLEVGKLHDQNVYITPEGYPIRGFMYAVSNVTQIEEICRKVYELVRCLESNEIPHNLFMTRGVTPKDNLPYSNQTVHDANERLGDTVPAYDCVRIYVWPRKANYMSKRSKTMNVAACEVSGHILVKDETQFDSISYEEIVDILKEFSYTREELLSFLSFDAAFK